MHSLLRRPFSCIILFLAIPGVSKFANLAGQTILLGGVVVELGDAQGVTIAKLSARLSIEPLDSINYVVRDRSPDHRAIGTVSFQRGEVSIVSRDWYSGRNDERAFGTALMGALQSLGMQQQPIQVSATYQTRQDPTTGLLRIATFVSGRRWVSVYYSEGPSGEYGVQITETIDKFGRRPPGVLPN